MTTRKTARAPWGCSTLSGAVAHAGIYINPEDREMTAPEAIQESVDLIQSSLAKGRRILVVGGASGMYGRNLQDDQRVVHLVSTEASRRDSTFTMPTSIGVALLSKFAAARLIDSVREQARERDIPTIGIFRSPGAVTRLLARALGWSAEPDIERRSERAAPPLTHSAFRDALHQPPQPEPEPDAPPDLGSAPVPAPAAAADATEQELLRVFGDAVHAIDEQRETVLAALAIARETAIAVYRDAVHARQDSDALRQLKKLLNTL